MPAEGLGNGRSMMKLATYNIHFATGQDDRNDLVRIADTVRDADIIGLQEVDRYWQRSGRCDQAISLAEQLPGYSWIYGAGYDAPVRLEQPTSATAEERGRRRQHGNMILSRWPILSSRVLPLPKAKRKEFCQLRVVIETVIDAPGGALRVYCMHLCHISAATRLPQVEQLLTYLETLPDEGATWSVVSPDKPSWTEGEVPPPYPDDVVFLGDMNFTPTSDEYGRLSSKADLTDSWTLLGRDPDAPAEYSCLSVHDQRTLRIDHIFVSPNVAKRVENGWIDQQSIGSDHYPVWIELR